MMDPSKQRLMVQSTLTDKRELHLLDHRVALQERYACFFVIADLQQLTEDPSYERILKNRGLIREIVADHLACGLDPERATIYLQSAIHPIYELSVLLELLLEKQHVVDCLQISNLLGMHAHYTPAGEIDPLTIVAAGQVADRFNTLYGCSFPQPQTISIATTAITAERTEEICQRRAWINAERGLVDEVLYEGTIRMQEFAETVLEAVREQMGIWQNWQAIAQIAEERRQLQPSLTQMGFSP